MPKKKIEQLLAPQGSWLAFWKDDNGTWVEAPVVFWALQGGEVVGLVSSGVEGAPGAHFECPETEPGFVGYCLDEDKFEFQSIVEELEGEEDVEGLEDDEDVEEGD